jgi:hypothetical protein
MRASLLALALLAGGCLAPTHALTQLPAPAPPPGPHLSAAVSFRAPVQLTGGLGGFEPSIRAGSGLLYVAAAKTTRPNAGPRLATGRGPAATAARPGRRSRWAPPTRAR